MQSEEPADIDGLPELAAVEAVNARGLLPPHGTRNFVVHPHTGGMVPGFNDPDITVAAFVELDGVFFSHGLDTDVALFFSLADQRALQYFLG